MTDTGEPSCSQSTESELPKQTECMHVVVRCRDMKKAELDAGYVSLVEVVEGSVNVRNPKAAESDPTAKKAFTFDAVYDWNSKQSDLYEGTFQSVVESVLKGYNGTILTYGDTGTGKTYVIKGAKEDPALKGVIPRSIEHIFKYISSSKSQPYLIRASYIQIYQEEIADLLDGDQMYKRKDMKESPDFGVYIKDLSSVVTKNIREMEHVWNTGNLNKDRWVTHMGPRSSAIHYIFTITVECNEIGVDGESHVRVGHFQFVDMAGSERSPKTGASGDRLKEATRIGLSLPAFGCVISALVDEKSKHIPYRNSKITRLLQDSLGGTAKTVMVACISPASYDETISTLRAKKVKNKPKFHVDPKYALFPAFLEEIERLKIELATAGIRRDLTMNKREGEMTKEQNSGTNHNESDNVIIGDKKEIIDREEQPSLNMTKEDIDALALKIKAMENALLKGEQTAEEQETALKQDQVTFEEVIKNTEKILICWT